MVGAGGYHATALGPNQHPQEGRLALNPVTLQRRPIHHLPTEQEGFPGFATTFGATPHPTQGNGGYAEPLTHTTVSGN